MPVEPPPESPTPPDHPPAPPVWMGLLASLFVLVALAALVVVPLLVQRRVDAVRARVEEHADPARILANSLRYELSREASMLFMGSITGSNEPLEFYREHRGNEETQLAQLERHAEALDGEALKEFVRFRTLAEHWHTRVPVDTTPRDSAVIVAMLSGARPAQPFADTVLNAAMRLDRALEAEAREGREDIRRIERAGVRVTLGLGVLALLAALAVAWLSWRVRQLARVATERGREAERALAETARVTEARARLLRGVSHDVKNPLGAARGYTELLEMGLKGPLNVEQTRYVQGIRRSIDGALAILADLLDLARADSGGLSMERVAADLSRVASEAAEDHRPAAASAGHAIECSMTGPVRAYTDPGRVRQVLGNLLSNAIKYTPAPGRIVVRAERVHEDAAHPGDWAVVRVTDTGPGIPPAMRESVFDEFSRLHDGTGIQGHGLGLAISRRVARLLGGDLDVTGAPGEGATFTVHLPALVKPPPPTPPPSEGEGSKTTSLPLSAPEMMS
ncbi:MAG TPA: HAMP domain-containing sensor histidine kinase, partial [Longimicrobium sp.]|nr:HAMP domain-containing sensor histidine kinase [Longimicrobium sp.]